MDKLEISSIDEGIVKCCNQAAQLIKDADLLYENKRYTTSYSLFQLASEESSKIKILLRLAIEKRSGITLMDQDRGKYFKKLFYSHEEKTKLGAITDQNFNELADRLKLPKFREEDKIQKEIEKPKELDLLKQEGLYVSFKENKFVSPSEIISEKECKELRDIVIFRHNRQKGTMENYFEHTDFMVKKFIESTIKENENKNVKN